MNDQNKAELRRLAEAAMNPMYIGDREAQSQERIRARSAFDAMARPSAVLSLLDENDQLKAESAQRIRSLQHMIDQTIPLVPVPGDPMWSRRITIDELLSERDQLRAEVEDMRKDAERWNWYAAKVAARVGVGLKKMNAEIDAAMAKEGSANG